MISNLIEVQDEDFIKCCDSHGPGCEKQGRSLKKKVLPPKSHAFGKTNSEWSAEWWKWQLSLPATNHPTRDTTGEFCDSKQSGKVWFLTGTQVNEFPDPANPAFFTIDRDLCEVPVGKAIFFPILNNECSTLEEPPFQLLLDEQGNPTNAETCAKDAFDGTVAFVPVSELEVTIDGITIENEDLKPFQTSSPVFSFGFDDPEDNILDIDNCSDDGVDCVNAKSVSYGYWIMLAPLSKGDHTINFTGEFIDAEGNLLFGLDVTYFLKVV